jgi:hypothetical protein
VLTEVPASTLQKHADPQCLDDALPDIAGYKDFAGSGVVRRSRLLHKHPAVSTHPGLRFQPLRAGAGLASPCLKAAFCFFRKQNLEQINSK